MFFGGVDGGGFRGVRGNWRRDGWGKLRKDGYFGSRSFGEGVEIVPQTVGLFGGWS